MAQILLGVAVILCGVALVVTELAGARRERVRVDREFAELKQGRDELRRSLARLETLLGDLENQMAEVRDDLASARTEARGVAVAEQAKGLKRQESELRADMDMLREGVLNRLAEATRDTEKLRAEAGRSQGELLQRLDGVRERTAELTQRVAEEDSERRRAVAELDARSKRQATRLESLVTALGGLEAAASWGAVRGAIECEDRDLGVVVEKLLLGLAEAAGLSLVSTRVLSSAPLRASYRFSGMDGRELADWFKAARDAGSPEVEALFEVLKLMGSGTVSLGPMTLGSDGRRPVFRGQ